MQQILKTEGQNDNILHFQQDLVHFGFDLDPEINAGLQKAARNISNREESLNLLQALNKQYPQQTEILIALYKSYFYLGQVDKAEEIIYQCLEICATHGNFPFDWNSLTPETYNWKLDRGPGRNYLYSLKALSFVRLKQECYDDSDSILKVIAKLDPDDKVGASVIKSLLSAMKDEGDET